MFDFSIGRSLIAKIMRYFAHKVEEKSKFWIEGFQKVLKKFPLSFFEEQIYKLF